MSTKATPADEARPGATEVAGVTQSATGDGRSPSAAAAVVGRSSAIGHVRNPSAPHLRSTSVPSRRGIRCRVGGETRTQSINLRSIAYLVAGVRRTTGRTGQRTSHVTLMKHSRPLANILLTNSQPIVSNDVTRRCLGVTGSTSSGQFSFSSNRVMRTTITNDRQVPVCAHHVHSTRRHWHLTVNEQSVVNWTAR